MKISCEIIKDLLPLYHDDVCSSESRSMVEEHLLECDACKKYLNSMSNDFLENNIEKATELGKSDALKRIKKKLLRKNVIVSIASILSVIIVFLGISNYQMPIAYQDGLLTVNKAYDGVIDIKFNGENYYSSYALSKTIEKGGIEQNAAYIYYTDSIWTKYIPEPFKTEEYQFSIGSNIMVDYGKQGDAIQSKENITVVYYLIGDYRDLSQMSNEEFEKATKDAILIWEE